MKKIANLKGAKALNSKEQKNIKGGGFTFPPADDSCICIYMGPGGYLILENLRRNSTVCPDGSPPDCGFIGLKK